MNHIIQAMNIWIFLEKQDFDHDILTDNKIVSWRFCCFWSVILKHYFLFKQFSQRQYSFYLQAAMPLAEKYATVLF